MAGDSPEDDHGFHLTHFRMLSWKRGKSYEDLFYRCLVSDWWFIHIERVREMFGIFSLSDCLPPDSVLSHF